MSEFYEKNYIMLIKPLKGYENSLLIFCPIMECSIKIHANGPVLCYSSKTIVCGPESPLGGQQPFMQPFSQ